MTKHEELRQFAAMAMQGLLSTMDKSVRRFNEHVLAKSAVESAQALQAALDAENPKPADSPDPPFDRQGEVTGLVEFSLDGKTWVSTSKLLWRRRHD